MIEQLLKLALVGSTGVLYLLLALSVVSIAAMIERVVYFWKRSGDVRALRRAVLRHLGEGELEAARKALTGTRAVEGRIVAAAVAWHEGGPKAVESALSSELGRAREDLEQGLNLLGTLGNNAPFVGLFGTVLGVIEAFHQLGDTGNKDAMGNVMAGIAEALVATGVGLFVALPAVVAYNVLQKRITAIETGAESLAKLFTAYLELVERQEGRGESKHPPKLSLGDDGTVLEVPGANDVASEAALAGE